MALASLATDPRLTQIARDMMVDSQIRPNKVTDARVIQAMRTLPREAFVPESQLAVAYADADVRLGHGRMMMEPMAIARLVQLAAPREQERALVIAAGTGYGAALLAMCGAAVTALEEEPALIDLARPALAEWAPSVTMMQGAIALDGAVPEGVFDLILIEGGVEHMPARVASLLAPSGRLVTVRETRRAIGASVGQAVVGRLSGGTLNLVPAFDLQVPGLVALRAVAGFVF